MIEKDEYKKAKKITDEYERQEKKELDKNLLLMKADLKEFFSKNKVGGVTVDEFQLRDERFGQRDIVEIFPDCFDENYWDDAADKKIVEIGNKYGVWLKFDASVYSK